jgi:hypothetical protein
MTEPETPASFGEDRDLTRCIEIVRAAAAAEILPRFRRLQPDHKPEVTRELVEAWYRDRAHIKFPERIELCLGHLPVSGFRDPTLRFVGSKAIQPAPGIYLDPGMGRPGTCRPDEAVSGSDR